MRTFALLPLLPLAACTTSGGALPPTEVIRYHLPAGVERGAATVEPAQAGLMSQPYEAAVARQLGLNGFPADAGPTPFVAVVEVHQREREGPPRRSAFSIGIGGGGFSGGRRGGGGVGIGGGVGFPVGGSRSSSVVETELSVLIKRRADQTTVWEGHARNVADVRRRDTSDAATADKLAAALFTGFPGESGRTISVP